MANNKTLKLIAEQIKELPGISTKQAERLAINIVEKPELTDALASVITLSKGLVKDPLTGLIVPVGTVANSNKDKEILQIVETNKDVNNILDKTNSTHSIFVLDITNKRDFKHIEGVLDRLFEVIKEYQPKEVLFLLTPSVESELIMRVIKEEMPNAGITNIPALTRLSMGIPFGGSIEFSDERTIKEAMSKREKA